MATFIPAPQDPLAIGIRNLGIGAGQGIGNLLQQRRQAQGLQQDLTGIQQFLLGQQTPGGPQLPIPTVQTPAGQNILSQLLLQQATRQPNIGQIPPELRVSGGTIGPSGTSLKLERKPILSTPEKAGPDDPSGLPEGTVFRDDPETGERKIIFQAPKGQVLTPKDKFDAANSLRKDFDAAQIKKDFETVRRSERGMEQAFRLATSPDEKSRIASDQALAVLFQKMLDPDSVVRESEYARTPEGAAAINQLTSIPDKIIKGGLRLEDTDRLALKRMADRLLLEAKRSMNDHIDRFSIIADESNLNKKIIFGNIKPFEIGVEVGQAVQQTPLTPQEEARRQELLRKAGQ